MKKTIDQSDFVRAFDEYNRGDNFSVAGRRALFDYLEGAFEGDAEYDLDVIALCCEYSEYDSAQDAMREYQPDDMPVEGIEGDDLLEIEEKNEKAALEWLNDRTQVIEIEGGGVIIQQF